MKKLFPFILLPILLLIGYANAQTVQVVAPFATSVYAGMVSFPVKVTSVYEDASGNMKFRTSTETFTAAVKLYIGEGGMRTELEFLSDDGMTTIRIKEVAFLKTGVKKSKTDQLLILGTGDFTTITEGKTYPGIACLDGKGILRKDTFGEVIYTGIPCNRSERA